jgi:hypothetical protein
MRWTTVVVKRTGERVVFGAYSTRSEAQRIAAQLRLFHVGCRAEVVKGIAGQPGQTLWPAGS